MKPVLTSLLLLSCIVALSQSRMKTILKADTAGAKEMISIPFSGIHVIDARFDQSKIGCTFGRITPFDFSMYVYKQDAVFPEALDSYLPRFLETFIVPDNTKQDELMVLVKQFRIADYCAYGETNDVDVHLALNLSASFYALHNGRYYKLFSVDRAASHTIYELRKKPWETLQQDTRAAVLQEILYNLLQKQSWTFDPDAVSYTPADVASAITRRFSLPVYDRAVKTGLYKTFKEFKNNTPSTTNISVVYKNGKITAVRDKLGRSIDLLDYWGLADGSKRYMIFRDEPVELQPCDKSFRVRSYRTKGDTKNITTIGNAVAQHGMTAASLGKSLETMRTPEYFDLDMESGDLYLQEMVGLPAFASIHH